MKNSLLKGLMVFLTMLCTSLTYSQDVSGTVSDASGPLPGASVLVKGTTKGAQTDFDGKMESFNVIAINYSPKVDHVKIESVYPNPFTSDFNIKYAMSTAGQIEITLANSNGIVVFKEEVYANEGANKYQYYADYDLPKGMYFLSIVQDGKTMTSSKLIKQ